MPWGDDPWGGGGGEYPYSRITIVDDEQEIFNAVTVSAPTLADQFAGDTASQVEFGRSDLPVSTILDSTGDMSDIAVSLAAAYSQPRRRIAQLRVDRIAADWGFFLSKELQDRVTVRHRPIYGGLFEQLSVIQGITIEVEDSENWAVTWNLTPPVSLISNPNLLTANQASMETDASGWVVAFEGGGGGFSSLGVAGGTIPLVGAQCLEAITYGVATIVGGLRTTPYNVAAVTPGETYRASAWVRSFWGSTDHHVWLEFWTSGGVALSLFQSSPFGPYLSGGTTEWMQGSVEGAAPGTAAFATVMVEVAEHDSGGHPFYVDSAELRHVGA
jgi:hypothetical protein